MGKETFENANLSVEETLLEYLSLGKEFENPPEVILSLYSQAPPNKPQVGVRDIAITTGIQCYSPGKAIMKERVKDNELSIGERTLDAGHHTTRQHAQFTWRLAGVSRNAIHDIFHGNPFYNSEQQSQRFAEITRGDYLLPNNLGEKQKEFYEKGADFANNAYFELLDLLKPEVEKRVRETYPKDGWKNKDTEKRLEEKIDKLSQEVARYVLPIAQKSNFFYSLVELQLLRTFRASRMSNFSKETKFVIARMIQEAAKVDPTLLTELDKPWKEVDRSHFSEENIQEKVIHNMDFDEGLGNRISKLRFAGNIEETRKILGDAIRNILGFPSDYLFNDKAFNLLLNPSENHYLADVYEVGMLDPLTQTLRQINLTFETKLSHTADSQRQRHRRTPGATPPIDVLYSGGVDYLTPFIIKENPKLKQLYSQMMWRIYENVHNAIQMEVPREWALYLLPNAHAVRVTESGDLFDWIHRWKQRLCYLAQEEIFFVSVDQAKQALEIFPEAKDLFLAPCGVRQAAGIKPRCPEGDKWCGKPVWEWQLDKYSEERLI